MIPYRQVRGFSLIELLVAIGIVGLISGIGLASTATIQKNARDAQRQADLRVIQSAIQQYYADNNHYPDDLNGPLTNGTSITNCTGKVGCSVVTKTYLTTTPRDPVVGTTTPYCYRSQVANVTNQADPKYGNCGGGSSGQCHFYQLCANLENPPGAAVGCSCSGSATFRVTPL